MGIKAGPTSSAGGGGSGQNNTISSQGGGTLLTAAVPKVGVDLRVISLAASGLISFNLAADLLTIDTNLIVNADIDAAAAIAITKLAVLTGSRNVITTAGGVLSTEVAPTPAPVFFFIGAGDTPGSGASEFYSPVSISGSSNELVRSGICPIAFVASNFCVRVRLNTRDALTTFNFRVALADGNQVVTIAASTTGSVQDTVNTDSVAQFDEIASEESWIAGTGSITLNGFAVQVDAT